MFKLRINEKEDPKLLQNFPNDPYTDLTIRIRNLSLHLSSAYLSIDSDYFANLPQGTSKVDLTHLP